MRPAQARRQASQPLLPKNPYWRDRRSDGTGLEAPPATGLVAHVCELLHLRCLDACFRVCLYEYWIEDMNIMAVLPAPNRHTWAVTKQKLRYPRATIFTKAKPEHRPQPYKLL